MTETMTSLAMVTKAGVPSNKVIVGVSSYARSFGMVDGGCHSPQCTFSGTATRSDATPGICTNTSGYISDAELYDILDGTDSKQGLRRRGAMVDRSRRHRRDVSDRVKEYYFDKESDSMIMVYDDDQWASFMDHDIRTTRTHKYAGLNLGGTTNWASDLEKFNPAPHDYKDWDAYKLAIKSGDTGFNGVDDPNANRTGNWTELTCDTPAIAQYSHMLASERWQSLGCPTAWSQFKQLWRKQEEAYPNSDSSRFTMSLIAFFGIHESASCDSIVEGNYCTDTIECLNLPKRNTTGPAAMQIWNSLVFLHNVSGSLEILSSILSHNPLLFPWRPTYNNISSRLDVCRVLQHHRRGFYRCFS